MDQTPTINNQLKTKLETTQIAPNWYLTKGHINNKFCIGYGKTASESQADAFKDLKVILGLKDNLATCELCGKDYPISSMSKSYPNECIECAESIPF